MKPIPIFIFFSLIFFSLRSEAQSAIGISSGISVDINNTNPFYMVPVTLYWKPFTHSEIFVEYTKGISFTRLSRGNAYTAGANLPDHVVLTEAVKLSYFSFDFGGAIRVYTNKKNNLFSINLSTGYSEENFRVNYRNYDNANYEVLDPDVSRKLSGLFASAAAVYSFHKRKQDMFISLKLQSNSTASPPDRYKLSYNGTAPLQLTYGYKFFYNKK